MPALGRLDVALEAVPQRAQQQLGDDGVALAPTEHDAHAGVPRDLRTSLYIIDERSARALIEARRLSADRNVPEIEFLKYPELIASSHP